MTCSDEVRSAFEDWYLSNELDLSWSMMRLSDRRGDEYMSERISELWKCWRSAWNTRTQQEEE